MYNQEDFEEDNSEYLFLPALNNLHKELIEFSAKEQIQEPYISSSNFFEQFMDETESVRRMDLSEDNVLELNKVEDDFCSSLLTEMNNRFNLGLDINDILSRKHSTILDITEALYLFFVINYTKNIRKFFVKFILSHQDELAELSDSSKRKDVTTTTMRKKVPNKNIAIILSNLDNIVGYIASLEIDPEDFISYFNASKFEVFVITDMINEGLIDGDFVNTLMSELKYTNKGYSFIHDTIMLGIRNSIYKKGME